MAKKKRQRISYVLPLASTPGGHRLGVNGLAFDSDRSILYTAGRDGVVCGWDVNISAQESSSYADKTSTATFRKQVQAHTHWVNDIVLVKNNLGVVSASSDVTVKLWRPHGHGQDGAYTIGSHSDYVKCLTSPDKNANWVASGGLDHRICLWDLAGGGSTLDINLNKLDETVNKGSIYTLKAKGGMIASGGPEGVVRLWDIKSGKSITKFVGHTDNVRDLLISEDGDTILSASSDQTIKAWSLTAGRCLHTLTMHNDSVWCMYSDDPNLAVFYSGDKSGLVAKTDTRRAMEIEEGVSVAVCQEHDGIARLVPAGGSIWTATSSSSVNRWKDVDTELEVQTPPQSPRNERSHSALSQQLDTPPDTPTTNGSSTPRIPHNAILKLANTALHPGRKRQGQHANHSVTNVRKQSEIVADDLSLIVPIRGQPAETIEGQNGLIKHVMLNDRKRILTLDTAGEVVLWDLLKCVPIKSFGRRHLDEVVPEVNSTESVANWCAVDTKTGKITVMLEENYAFDAEVYADEIEIAEKIEFREDQRINLGKWVLRNLFTTLLDEEIRRDETYRKKAASDRVSTRSGTATPALRANAPTSIAMPSNFSQPTVGSPGTAATPKANGFAPFTPGLAIGAATPGHLLTQIQGVTTPGSAALSPSTEAPLDKALSRLSQQPPDGPTDYFSNTASAANTSDQSSENKEPATPAADAPASNPTSPTEEKKKSGLFGKKFQMGFQKKPPRPSSEAKPAVTSPVATEEKSDDAASRDSSDKEEKLIEDNFLGTVQRIRHEYDEHAELKPEDPLPPGIMPSLPNETPVLKPPPHTVVIIQEDNPESGGLADQYRGEIGNLGKEADVLEKIAPMWLGELLLRNQIPFKETVKVSFVLHPFEDLLPSIASPDGNSRLNANRMLRAKKILAYVAERIEAPPPPPPQPAEGEDAAARSSTEAPSAPQAPAAAVEATPQSQADRGLRPEEYLELYCQGIRVDPNMTLATLRVHLWGKGGDVVLYYKSNGRKQLRLPHPSEVPTKEESKEGTGVAGE